MYNFGKSSLSRLETCHPDIQLILHELIKIYDVSVLEGKRSEARQMELFKEGKSHLDGVNKKSKHQPEDAYDNDGILLGKLSYAVDIMPWKAGTNAFSGAKLDDARFYFMMGLVRVISIKLLEQGLISHKVRFGLDWDSDDVYSDSNFHDLPHFELIEA